MQYQHPDWDKKAKRKAWLRRIETAAAAILLLLGAVAVIAWLKPWNTVLPGSATFTPEPDATAPSAPPSAEGAARAFLDAWQSADYSKMYSLLTPLTRDAYSEKEFSAFYKDIGRQTTLRSLDYSLLGPIYITPTQATVDFEVTMRTNLVGDVTRQTQLFLKLEEGEWRIAWIEDSAFPGLEGGNRLVMHRDFPERGNIYDRAGLVLATNAEVVEIGIIPGEITDEEAVLTTLAVALRTSSEMIRLKYAYASQEEYVPIAEVDATDLPNESALSGLGGVYLHTSTLRYYYGSGVASHVVGYLSKITPETLEEYLSRGYSGGETVGATGLERSAEPELAGRPGATLMLTGPDGMVVEEVAHTDRTQAMDVTTTLDRDLQAQIERYVLGPYNGAVVVLSRDTGEVLAMVSSKKFDSNLFVPGSVNGSYGITDVLNDPDGPLNNRATNGLYPLGSVFKIITMAAGLESGLFTPESLYNDETGIYIGSDGVERTDWVIEKEMKPHGEITLEYCLVQSCNPCFWHVGETLYNQDPRLVPEMAKAFGLGSATGIPGLEEAAGNVPGPDDGEWTVSHALDQAVGQGGLLVTPLQVADFIAAIGNGGTLYRPQIMYSIKPTTGAPVFSFSPVVRGLLPVSAENLQAIQTAMRGVVNDPKGTAWARYYGISSAYKIAGKTGTAESGKEDPHAWFAAYTFNAFPNKPDIAVTVIAEYAGEGSEYAARMARRVLEIYFIGKPVAPYPWESEYGIRATDTPEVTEEPTVTLSPEGE